MDSKRRDGEREALLLVASIIENRPPQYFGDSFIDVDEKAWGKSNKRYF
jgi:hypothetical protein